MKSAQYKCKVHYKSKNYTLEIAKFLNFKYKFLKNYYVCGGYMYIHIFSI